MNPQAADRESLHQGAYVVAPDRGLLTVTVHASAATLAEALTTTTNSASALVDALKAVPGCEARLADVDLPHATGQDHYGASAEVFVDVDLRQLATVAERAARLASCLRVLDEELRRVAKVDALGMTPTTPLLTVDNPKEHLDVLLRRAAASLQAAKIEGTTPPLFPDERRCVPTGEVIVTSRRLSGLALEPQLECRVAPGGAG